MTKVPINQMSVTWNDQDTTYSAIKLDVNDVASTKDSKLIEITVNNKSKFEVTKDGAIKVNGAALGENDEPDGFDVFLLAGSTNMVGKGGPVDPVLDSSDLRIMQFGHSDGKVKLAEEPLDNRSESADDIGLGLTFAKNYLGDIAPNRKVLLVPAAQDGTGFGFDGGFWTPSGSGYLYAVSGCNTAMEYGEGTNKFAGILWHQGEGDDNANVTEQEYTDYLTTLVGDLRTNINGASSKTPFVCANLTTAIGGAGAGVETALDNVPNYLLYAETAPVSGLTLDGTNFDASSLRTLGERYYTSFNTAKNKNGEITAQRHWLFGTDNERFEDLVIGSKLNVPTGNTSPYVQGNYISLRLDGQNDDNNGMVSDVADAAVQTVCAVVKFDAVYRDRIFFGSASSPSASPEVGSAMLTTDTGGNRFKFINRDVGVDDSVLVGLTGGQWYFVAYQVNSTTGFGFVGPDNVGTTLNGTKSVSPNNIALGNNYYDTFSDEFDCAEFIIYDYAMTSDQLKQAYQRSKLRLAERGVEI